MGIEITTALIAFGGVIIGLASSYLLQFLQRRWLRNDQMRKWHRAKLEELSQVFSEMAGSVSRIYMMHELTAEDVTEMRTIIAKNIISAPPHF